MSTTVSRARATGVWWESTHLWAGLSIVSIWVAVLFVGVFGPNFTTTTNNAAVNGSSTTVPAVIAVAVCALFATTAIARTALRPSDEK